MTAVEIRPVELAPCEPSSSELEAEIRQVVQAHQDLLQAGADMIAAAARAGHVLAEIKARRQHLGGWRAWIAEHMPFTYATAHLYMKCAQHEALIREQGWTRINQVKEGLGALVPADHKAKGANGKGKPEWMKSAAREMYRDGEKMAHIARDLGVSPSAVKCWVDPAYNELSRQKVAAINKRRIRADREMRERERTQAIKAVVRQERRAMADLYALAERMQDIIGRAHSEATDRERRRHLSLAGEHYRKMRDEIVAALGVQA